MLGDKTLNYAYNYDEDLDGKLNNVVLPNNLTQYIAYDKLGRTNEIKLGDHIKQLLKQKTNIDLRNIKHLIIP